MNNMEIMDGLALTKEKQKFKQAAKALFEDLKNQEFDTRDIYDYLEELTLTANQGGDE